MSDPAQQLERARRLFGEGAAHYDAGRYGEAEACFERALALVPGRPSLVLNLAAARNKLGRHAQALSLLDALVAQQPGDVDAWLQRGAALAGLARLDEALVCQQRALALQPDHPVALYQRGSTLNALRRPARALADFERLTALQPDGAEAWLRRGQTLQRLSRLDEALACYDRALAIAPAFSVAWTQRGSALQSLGRRDDAAASFREAMAHGGDAQLNGWYLAALTGQALPAGAPRGYVQALFDDYADDFEQHLVQVLGYRAHLALAEQLQRIAPGRRFASALDLGCGSGLCGMLLRPRADRLTGVDLSERMVEQARARGVYDELAQADAAEHLAATPARHDLVLAADVFIYVGRLDEVFAGVRRVLQPQGLFCFSVEHAPQAREPVLTPGLRYAHSAPYLRALAARHGFEVLEISAQPIRAEQGRDIEGLLVALRG